MPFQLDIFRAAAIVAILAYICAGLFIPLAALDALYLPDDTYYTLSIARNIAAGLGSSTDGIIQTTGFQPLIALLLQPVFLAGFEGDGALRAAIALSSGFGAVAIVLAGGIVRQATQSGLAGAAAIVLAVVSSPVLANALNGLETTLAATIALPLVWAASQTRADSPNSRLVWIGMLAGLGLWARIDLGLVILVLVPVALWRVGVWRTGLVAFVAAITVSPWVIYCVIVGGSLIPESGGAVRQIVAALQEAGRGTMASNVMLSTGQGASTIFSWATAGWKAALAIVFVIPPALAWRSGRIDAVAILCCVAITLILFYALVLPAYWFFHRYLFLTMLIFVVAVVVLGWKAVQAYVPPAYQRLSVLVVAGLVAVQVPTLMLQSRAWGADVDFNTGGHGYGRMAKEIMASVPDGAIVTAMQSGALNWFSPTDVRVVNLDGVVNGSAKDAIRNGTLDSYLKDIGATHFGDWPFHVNWLHTASTSTVPLRQIAVMPDHGGPGGDFTLYEIVWPDGTVQTRP